MDVGSFCRCSSYQGCISFKFLTFIFSWQYWYCMWACASLLEHIHQNKLAFAKYICFVIYQINGKQWLHLVQSYLWCIYHQKRFVSRKYIFQLRHISISTTNCGVLAIRTSLNNSESVSVEKLVNSFVIVNTTRVHFGIILYI